MAQGREDRRVRITKQAIRETLVELMSEYPISKISVKMICEAADINRSTFYAHYADQYDLLRQVQRDTIDDIKRCLVGKTFTASTEATVPVLAQVLGYARDNAALFKVLLRDDRDMAFMNDLMHIAQEQTLKELRTDTRLGAQTSKYLQYFAIYGFMSIIGTWLDDGTPEEPEELAETITKLMFQGMSAFYR